jgi:hypothetical protein
MICACATQVTSSGEPVLQHPLERISVIPAYKEFDGKHAHGDTDLVGDALPVIQNFADDFTRLFATSFPDRLALHGVTTVPRQAGVPRLVVKVTSYEEKCPSKSICNTNVQFRGRLLGDNSQQLWSFTTMIHADAMNNDELRQIEDDIITTMTRDHVIVDQPAAR